MTSTCQKSLSASAALPSPPTGPSMASMSPLRRILLHPMNIALLLTWLAVGLTLPDDTLKVRVLGWSMMLVFLAAALLTNPGPATPRWQRITLLAIQIICAMGLVVLDGRSGTTPVLLVVIAAHLGLSWPLRTCLLVLLVIDVALFLVLREVASFQRALFTVLVFAGFQGFALLVGHYARTAERARDTLALVNADLLATRALLADSARDAERLHVARELHDIAGHKLTALKLNLRALAADPALADRDEVRVAQSLSSELLDDIRGVVHAIRDTRGLDLDTALRALAAPLPNLRLALHIAPDVQVTAPAQAEAVLRLVQESLTNAVRHGGARTVQVGISRGGDGLDIRIEDDGLVRGTLQEGSGLAGMRERVAGLGGRIEILRTDRGGLGIHASLPA